MPPAFKRHGRGSPLFAMLWLLAYLILGQLPLLTYAATTVSSTSTSTSTSVLSTTSSNVSYTTSKVLTTSTTVTSTSVSSAPLGANCSTFTCIPDDGWFSRNNADEFFCLLETCSAFDAGTCCISGYIQMFVQVSMEALNVNHAELSAVPDLLSSFTDIYINNVWASTNTLVNRQNITTNIFPTGTTRTAVDITILVPASVSAVLVASALQGDATLTANIDVQLFNLLGTNADIVAGPISTLASLAVVGNYTVLTGTTTTTTLSTTTTTTTTLCRIGCCYESSFTHELSIVCHREFELFGASPLACNAWVDGAQQTCVDTCGNCSEITSAVLTACQNMVQANVSNPSDEGRGMQQCTRMSGAFLSGRCPSLCRTVDQCESSAATTCMDDCGNYQGCDCYSLRHIAGEPTTCVGNTLLQGEIPGTLGATYSCAMVPQKCYNHVGITACGPYKHCPIDQCALFNVTCPFRSSCELPGSCNPADGKCYYVNYLDGTPCDDGLAYTFNTRCVNGECVGIEDLCARHNTVCNTTNPCLLPGTCDSLTGSCIFTPKADRTACNMDFGGVLDGYCRDGLCHRNEPNRCQGVSCPSLGQCYRQSTCHQDTGECSRVPVDEGWPCDDSNPATFRDMCVEGQCVGDYFEQPEYQKVGHGYCADEQGVQLLSYHGDVADRDECERQCTQDPACRGYTYGYYVCIIHTVVRRQDPSSSYWRRHWEVDASNLDEPRVYRFQNGIEYIRDLVQWRAGQHSATCYRKAYQGDPPEEGDPLTSFYLACTVTVLASIPLCYIATLNPHLQRAVVDRCLRALGVETSHERPSLSLLTASRLKLITKSRLMSRTSTLQSTLSRRQSLMALSNRFKHGAGSRAAIAHTPSQATSADTDAQVHNQRVLELMNDGETSPSSRFADTPKKLLQGAGSQDSCDPRGEVSEVMVETPSRTTA